MRFVATVSLVYLLFMLMACGGGSSSPASTVNQGPLSGNWQMALVPDQIRAAQPFSVSGFFLQSNTAVTGSVVLPGSGNTVLKCAGVGTLTGTMNGQNITLSVDEGGSTLSLTGVVSSDNKSMVGQYVAPAGGCTTRTGSGTWSAVLVPSLKGTFTGTLTNSTYMQALTGMNPPAPIVVSGTMSQSANIGASNATLTGTINAVGYPCFSTASLSGTITGTSVYLTVFGFDGSQIGILGDNAISPPAPATVSFGNNKVSLFGAFDPNTGSSSGLQLGQPTTQGFPSTGPCPALLDSQSLPLKNDAADVSLAFQ